MIDKIINNMTSKPGIYKMLDHENKMMEQFKKDIQSVAEYMDRKPKTKAPKLSTLFGAVL